MVSRLGKFVLAGMLGAALVLGATVPMAAAASVTLKYSTFFPPTHIQAKLADAWCKEVEKRTGGKVKVEFFPAGTPYQGQANL